MSVHAETTSDYATRTTGGFLSLTQDWTVTLWGTPTAGPPAPFSYRTFYQGDAQPGYPTIVYIGQEPGGKGQLYAWNNVASANVDTAGVLAANTWRGYGATFTAATNTFAFYQWDGATLTTVGSFVLNMASAPALTIDRLGYDGSGGESKLSLAYVRAWQRKLTPTQIQAELSSSVVQVRTNLFLDTPLPNPSHLEDMSGNGRDWTAAGTLTYVTGPLPLPDVAPWRLYEYSVKPRPEQRA